MNVSEGLQDLVAALNSAEKRLYIQFARGNFFRPGATYERMFLAIDQGKSLDEVMELSARGKAHSNPTAAQNQLSSHILRAMRLAREGKRPAAQVQALLEEIAFLFEKGLLDQMARRLRKCRKLASREELHVLHLEALEWERKLFFEQSPDSLQERLAQIEQEEQWLMERIREDRELVGLHQRIWVLSKTGAGTGSQAMEEEVRTLREHGCFQAPPPPGFMAQVYYHNSIGLLHLLASDHPAAKQHFEKARAVWMQRPEKISLSPRVHRVTLTNLLNCCFYTGDREVFTEIGAEINQLKGLTQLQKTRLMSLRFYLDLMLCLNYGDTDRGLSLEAEIQAWLREFGEQVPAASRVNFYYNLAVFHFMGARFSASLREVNGLLNFGGEARQDLLRAARMLELLLHVELAHWDLLTYRLRAWERWLKQQPDIWPHEHRLLRFLRDLNKQGGQPADPGEYQEVMKVLEADAAGRGPRAGMTEVAFWLGARMEGKGIEAFYRSRLAEKKG